MPAARLAGAAFGLLTFGLLYATTAVTGIGALWTWVGPVVGATLVASALKITTALCGAYSEPDIETIHIAQSNFLAAATLVMCGTFGMTLWNTLQRLLS